MVSTFTLYFCLINSFSIVPATIYPNERLDKVVGVKDYDFSFGFVIEHDFPPVQLNNIQWHFTNLSNVTVDLRANGTDSAHYTLSKDFRQLQITNVQLSDRGHYTLTATNEAGIRNSTINLDVHGNYTVHTLYLIFYC